MASMLGAVRAAPELARAPVRHGAPRRGRAVRHQQSLSIGAAGSRVGPVRSPTELTELFRQRGMKVTPQRRAVFHVLHGNPEHPTAEGIHARVSAEIPDISLRTVYQVLNDLADMGELERLDLGTGSSRLDPNVDPHHHLVCSTCGTVQDVPAVLADIRLPEAHRAGFRVSSTEVTFRGCCPTCRAAAGGAHSDPVPPTMQPRQEESTDG